jgi:Flp pilus assembly protein TadB
VIGLGAVACGIAAASVVFALTLPALPSGERIAKARSLGVRLVRWYRGRRNDARAGLHALALLQGVHAALRSGMPLPLALRIALEDLDEEARSTFQRPLRAFDLGMPLDEALRAAGKASHDRRAGLALEALSLVAAEQLAATRSAGVIASIADRLAFDERLQDEVMARTSGVRAQIVLLACLVPALAIYLAFTVPGLASTLGTPLGRNVLLPAALLFEAAGIIASRRIVRGLVA